MDSCSVDGCERCAAKGEAGLCFGHARRKRRGLPVSVKLREYARTGKKRLSDAAIRLADAESDKDFERAMAWLLKAAQRMRRKDNVRSGTKTPSRG